MRLLFKVNALTSGNIENDASLEILEKFANYALPKLNFKDQFIDGRLNNDYAALLRRVLGKWTDVSLNLLKDNKALIPVDTGTDFIKYFNGASL